jgi:hypothetical protein
MSDNKFNEATQVCQSGGIRMMDAHTLYAEGASAVSRAATGRGEAEQPDSKIYEHVLGQVGLLRM